MCVCVFFFVRSRFIPNDNNNAAETDDSKFYLAQHRKKCVFTSGLRDLSVAATHGHSRVRVSEHKYLLADISPRSLPFFPPPL